MGESLLPIFGLTEVVGPGQRLIHLFHVMEPGAIVEKCLNLQDLTEYLPIKLELQLVKQDVNYRVRDQFCAFLLQYSHQLDT